MDLELIVNRSVAWAHAIEMALHDPGPWTFRTASGTTPAHRVIDGHHGEIVFTGVVSPCEDRMVELWSSGRMVTVSPIDFDKGERVRWRLSLKEPSRAS